MRAINQFNEHYTGEIPDQGRAWSRIESRFVSRIYGWMFLGLVVTAITSLGVASSESAIRLFLGNPFLFYGALVAEFALVLGISSGIDRISAVGAKFLFLVYSALNGLSFSVIFLAYSLPSVGNVFLPTAGMFGGLSIFGTLTRKNLSGVGTFFGMGLWGLILFGIVNIFVRSESLNFGLSVAGVVVFAGLAAFDAQKIRGLAREYSSSATVQGDVEKAAIFGALTLYLDLINLFLSLLRIFGKRRE